MADLGITENVEQTIDELAAAAAQAFLADNEPFEDCRDASTQVRAFLFPDGPLFALREEGGASPYSTITRAVMGSRSALEQYRVVRPMRTAAARTEDIALAPAVLP